MLHMEPRPWRWSTPVNSTSPWSVYHMHVHLLKCLNLLELSGAVQSDLEAISLGRRSAGLHSQAPTHAGREMAQLRVQSTHTTHLLSVYYVIWKTGKLGRWHWVALFVQLHAAGNALEWRFRKAYWHNLTLADPVSYPNLPTLFSHIQEMKAAGVILRQHMAGSSGGPRAALAAQETALGT